MLKAYNFTKKLHPRRFDNKSGTGQILLIAALMVGLCLDNQLT